MKRRVAKPSANAFHAFVATTGLALLALHLLLLLVHDYLPLGILDVLIPMRGGFRPVAIAAGIVAMYAMVLVAVSSWMRGSLSTRLWRVIHLLAVPAFVLALLHGVFAGTDTERPWMEWLYAVTGISTFFLVVVRGLTAGYRPPRPAPPARAARTPSPASTP